MGLPYGSESDQKNGQVTGLKKKLWMKQQFSNRYSSHLNQKQKVFFIYKKKNFNKKILCQKVYLECLNTSTFFFILQECRSQCAELQEQMEEVTIICA